MSLPSKVVFEASLAEGFSFQPKKPCKPGQFFNRPQQQVTDFRGTKDNSAVVTEGKPTNNHATLTYKPAGNRVAPVSLELPEFASSSHHGTPTSSLHQGKGADSSPIKGVESSPKSTASGRGLKPDFQETKASDTRSNASSDQKQILASSPQPKEPGDLSGSCQNDTISPTTKTQSTKSQPKFQVLKSPDARSRKGEVIPDFTALPHVRQLNDPKARVPPSSSCGDLEGPVAHSPAKSQRLPRRSQTRKAPRSLATREDYHIHFRERSTSRISNTSRKRTSHPEPSFSEREKQDLMQQFARTWNHLLQEFENEKSTLSEKYTNQKRHVTRLEQSLTGAQKDLQREQQDREALEKRVEAFEAQNETMAQDNERANLELECLRKSLAESEQKTSKISERSKSYRSKLNEVIEEQQSLYKQTMMHYQSLAQEIEGERSNLNEKSQKVEEALRESQRKREALLKGCHELQAHKDAEMVQKDIIISNLQENLKEKKEALHVEQQRAERLSNQIDKMHEENEYGLKNISSKVAEILKLSKESHRDQETNNLLAGAMVERFNEVASQLSHTVGETRSPFETEATVSALEKGISSRLAPSIDRLSRQQELFVHQMSDIGTRFANELSHIREGLVLLYQQHEDTGRAEELNKAHILTTLTDLAKDVDKTRTNCEDILPQLDSTTARISRNLQTSGETNSENLRKQVESLTISIRERENQMERTEENHAANTKEFSTHLADNEKRTEALIRREFSNLNSSLLENINSRDEFVKSKLLDSETVAANLQSRLDEVEPKLKEAQTHVCPDVAKLESDLRNERNSVSELGRELDALQEQMAKAEERERQMSLNIEAISCLESDLLSMTRKFNILETEQSELNNFFEFKPKLDRIAQFLEAEQDWMKRELSERDSLKLQMSSSQGQRKVMVQSPMQSIRAPSPILSVHQEQTRRREGRRLRSILKSSQTSKEMETSQQEPPDGNVDNHTMTNGINHTKYNRPVMADAATLSSLGDDNSTIVENIKSIQVPDDSSRKRTLPTVAEYQKSQGSLLRSANEAETGARLAKRPKMEPPGSLQTDQTGPGL